MNKERTINAQIKNINMEFKTHGELFSPKDIDKGTMAMLSQVEFEKGDKVLDLGCGYGVVGILAAKIISEPNVVMVDKCRRAVRCARENAELNGVSHINIKESDGFKNIQEKDFTVIVSHPPYHADFSVPKEFIEKGFNRLALGGRMYLVTKRKEWYKNKLLSIFGGVRIWEIDGYYVFMSIKKDTSYAKSKKKKEKKNKKIA